MVAIAISACLLGEPCRWDGQAKPSSLALSFMQAPEVSVIPFCPEVLGGLSTPRDPSELVRSDMSVCAMTRAGAHVTDAFRMGAKQALAQLKANNVVLVIAKEGSPSCGSSRIYDGSFTGQMIEGEGMSTQLFRQNGMVVVSEERIMDLFSEYCAKHADECSDVACGWDAEDFALWVQKNATIN